ncbi:tonB dependent receptor family protein [Asticcacaulis biprosthecium C19]|uniref:TonB dependent receptor family protein n=1 Tax=Asticcacaulis biprosthecium C19 TaxID=715226 RepID=F4QIE0_9CAUL|nr:TonB-dependent receptor [Asticcacaulis biprosthecium]EGF91778.1 tonB dependent receptor family protein [Asticcacaulis biprosthecium C19]
MRFQPARRGLRTGVSAVAVAAVLSLSIMAGSALAADTSTLQGKVTAGAGSVVTVTDTASGQSVTTTVRPDGTYVIVGLRPSTYHVTVGQASEDITLAVGETTTLDLDAAAAAAPAPAGTAVTIRGRRQKEVRTSEVATNVSQTQINNLPQNGRNFLNFAALAPGVSVTPDAENKQFRAGATYANQVNVFIDGQSQKNQVLQGGTAGQDSSRGNPFPQLAIQEFKVSTQNFKAEYEQAGTAIISAVTKSGGNEFHGSAFVTYQSKDMIGQPYYQRANPKSDYQNKEFGFDIGGPIIKDKLHFYVAYEGREDQRPTDAVNMPEASIGIPASLANALKAEDGVFEKNFKEDLFFGKLTWTPNDYNTVDISYQDRQEDDVRDFGGSTAYSHGSTLDQYVRQGMISWKYREETILNEMTLEYQSYHWRQSPLSLQPGLNIIRGANDFNTVALLGGATYFQEKAQDNVTFRNTMTYTGLEWHGRHVIKGGVKLAVYDYLATEGDHFNPEFFYSAQTFTYGGGANNTPVRVRIADGDPRLESTNTQWGLFLQDDWTVNDHLTLNLGLRWDFESNMLNDEFVTDPGVAAALRGWANFKNGGFDANDYISNGSNREAFKGAFAPRIGFSYDVHGDRQLVIFGGYGRYYDRTIYDNAQLETRRTQIHIAQIDIVPQGATPGAGQIAWNPAYYSDPSALVSAAAALDLKGEIFALNNEAKVPYSDQFNIGVRKQFGQIATSVTYANIQSKDMLSFVLGNRNPDGSWCVHGDQYACQPWGSGLPGYGSLIISTNDQEARYQALYFTVDKPYSQASGYGYSGTLTLTDAEATGHNDRFIFDYAMPHDTGWHAAEGVDKWRFVGTGIVDGPWDTQLSAFVTVASGGPFDYIDNTGPALRIIPGGIYPKDDPAYKSVDLRISKDFTLPNGQVITVDGQVYNAFDWVNKTYSGWGGGFNGGSGASGEGDTNTVGSARSFQVGLRYKW